MRFKTFSVTFVWLYYALGTMNTNPYFSDQIMSKKLSKSQLCLRLIPKHNYDYDSKTNS